MQMAAVWRRCCRLLARGGKSLSALPGDIAAELDLVRGLDRAPVGDRQVHALIIQVFDKGHRVPVNRAGQIRLSDVGSAVARQRPTAIDTEGIGVALLTYLAIECGSPGSADVLCRVGCDGK